MLRSLLGWLTAAMSLIFTSSPVLAHHGVNTKFDPDNEVSLSGRVTNVDWANPHAHIFMATEAEGEVNIWFVEMESPLLLELNGWTRDTLKPGDAISVQGFVARDGSPQVWGNNIVLDSTGETVLNVTEDSLLSLRNTVPGGQTPRWPDGQPRLGAPEGETGYWAPVTTVFMEDGVDVAMAANGQLMDINDADRVAPLQEWALRLYEFRQRNNLRFDPTFLECRPPSGPRKYQVPFGIQLLEDRQFERIFVIAGGGNHDWHLIYTDGRALDGGFQLDDGNELYYGRAVGEWQDDSLVIESEGFNEKFWLTGGLPHTSRMRLTERLTREDLNTLNYEVRIDDPGAYTRAWTASWTLEWIPGEDPPEYYCQDNRL